MVKSVPPSRRLFPNPFYVLLLVSSTVFVVTTLGYLVGEAPRGIGGGPEPGGLAGWLDRHGPTALGVEFLVMLGSGLLAMFTDRWFPEKPPRPSAKPD